ncbi:MAG: NlpC/P60 family protein [Actinobacteria bacterium]|nr:NlpC/P60 family protein [Actinomycetota bacterium]
MRTISRRTFRLLIVGAVALVLSVLFCLNGQTFAADQWTDITDAAWKDNYGLAPEQVATVAEGYSDGTFHPASPVIRAQFAKMSVSAFCLQTASPPTPTFTDVPPESFYYPWVEGGVAASIIAESGTYKPFNQTTRADASLVVAAYLSKKEISTAGKIVGRVATYSSLAAWYKAEGASVLKYYKDKDGLSEQAAPSVAYLAYRKVVQGLARSGRLYLDSGSVLTRAQAVAFIIRAKSAGFDSVVKTAPKVTAVGPTRGLEAGGNAVVIIGSGFWGAKSVSFGRTAVSSEDFSIDSQSQITVRKAPAGSGIVDVVVTTGLGRSSTGSQDKYSYVPDLAGGDLAVAEAVQHVGVPYVWAGDGPYGFDCSGLVMYVYAKLGIRLPHSSAAQSTMGTPVARDQLQPGDLVFFYNPVHHVGIYIGAGNMIDAPGTGSFVRIEKVWTSSYTGARDVLSPPPVALPQTP